jgi:uncharacterized protein (TIGR03067 family)
MPYVRGTSLQKRLDREGPLSLQETLRIGAQIAAGLAAAHAQGLVHRDIKPANVLLEEGVERVTITDFGLARAADDATITHSGMIAGTPQYMSPEQARGEGVDARSDLFSLGSVLYAMCTGRSPFRAETSYGVLRRITDDEPTAIREINPDVPTWLCQIISRLMAKRPADRYQSAGEVAELLEACLAHVQRPTAVPLPEELHVRRASTLALQRRWSVRRMLATAAAAIALFLAGVVIVLELNKGTLTIESEADDVALRIRQGDETVEKLTVSRAGKQVRIAAGKYVVEVDGPTNAVNVKDGNVTIERGGAEIVKIVQRDAAGAKVSQRGERSGDKTPPLATEVDRRTGETSRGEKSAERIVRPTNDLDRLQGTWEAEIGSGDTKYLVRFTVERTNFVEVHRWQSDGREITHRGKIILDESVEPKRMTMKISGASSSGAVRVPGWIPPEVHAIYKLDDKGLTRRTGSREERPPEFDHNDARQIVFNRHERRSGAADLLRAINSATGAPERPAEDKPRNSTGREARRGSTQSGPSPRTGETPRLETVVGRVGAEELLVGTWNGQAGQYGESYTFQADGTYTHESTAGRHTTSAGTWEFDGRTFSLILNTTKSDDQQLPARRVQIVKVVGLGADRLAFDNPSGPIAFTRGQPQALRCELRPAKVQWAMGQTPTLTCKIENSGKTAHTTRLEQGFHRVEVDGSPYNWTGDVTSQTKPIAAGDVVEIRFALAESDWAPLWTAEYRRNQRLRLNPGKHRVRVCIFAGSGDDSSLTAEPLTQVWSNAVEIEIVAAEHEQSDASSVDERVKSRDLTESDQTRP